MEQAEAREKARELREQGREAVATTRNHLEGRWEQTCDWVVTEYGVIVAE